MSTKKTTGAAKAAEKTQTKAAETVESVTCRWCGQAGSVEPRPMTVAGPTAGRAVAEGER